MENITPYIVSGVTAGLVAWASMRVEMAWLRRDVDTLNKTVQGADNPNNLVRVAQQHEYRLQYIEGHGKKPNTEAEWSKAGIREKNNSG